MIIILLNVVQGFVIGRVCLAESSVFKTDQQIQLNEHMHVGRDRPVGSRPICMPTNAYDLRPTFSSG